MSDSSDEGEPFQLRDYDEDTDDDRPHKRRRTMQPLRGKGLGFVKSTGVEDQVEDDEEDIDDARPAMGGFAAMNAFQNGFKIGEYEEEANRDNSPPARMSPEQPSQPLGSGLSAFGRGGKIQKNSFAARMMAKQGYVDGQGLGKSGQGITAPIQAKVLQNRAGLGVGSGTVEPARKDAKKKINKTDSSGTSTPRLKAPSKTKYTVTAIESRGLHVPDSLKSLIVDATGAEARTVTSLSGFSTPVRDASPVSESTKAAARVKLQLQAYADAWDTTITQKDHIENEQLQLQDNLGLHDEILQKYMDVEDSFRRVSTEHSELSSSWDEVVDGLVKIQDQFGDLTEELELPEMAVECLKMPFRREVLDWNPFENPDHLIDGLQPLGALLDIERAQTHRHRKRTTHFESLLLLHWYPQIRKAFVNWDIYNPDVAYSVIKAWTPLLSPWLLYTVLHELVLPKLIRAVRKFPKRVEPETLNQNSTSRKQSAPELHSWLFDWWSLLADEELDLELFPELRHAVKSKLDSNSWPMWKPLLGSRHRKAPAKSIPVATSVSTPIAVTEEVSFRDIVEEWCSENNLVLRSSQKSDAFGRLLYRLQDADRRSKGVLVYLQDDVVFGEDGEPYGLDEVLLSKALRR